MMDADTDIDIDTDIGTDIDTDRRNKTMGYRRKNSLFYTACLFSALVFCCYTVQQLQCANSRDCEGMGRRVCWSAEKTVE
jgi:hypothetical protein